MKRCVLFVGGIINDYDAVEARLTADDLLIAVDSGARHLAALNRIPQLLIGDMDSIEPSLRTRYLTSGVPCREYRPEKDETDGELAVEAALASGAEEVLIFGILGDRLDHFLGVLSLLKRLQDHGVRGVMVSETQEIWLVEGEERLALPEGALVSFLPFGDEAVVTLRGFQYPLTDYVYRQGKPIGLSNVIKNPPATVSVARGILVAVATRQMGKKD